MLLLVARDRAALCTLQCNQLFSSSETQRNSHLVRSSKTAHHLPPLQNYQEIRGGKKPALTKISHLSPTQESTETNFVSKIQIQLFALKVLLRSGSLVFWIFSARGFATQLFFLHSTLLHPRLLHPSALAALVRKGLNYKKRM